MSRETHPLTELITCHCPVLYLLLSLSAFPYLVKYCRYPSIVVLCLCLSAVYPLAPTPLTNRDILSCTEGNPGSESIERFIEVELSRGRKIWLIAHPLPPSPIWKIDWRQTGRLRNRDNLLTGEGLRGAGEVPNHTTTRKLVFYKSLNTLLSFPPSSPIDFSIEFWLMFQNHNSYQ